MSELLLLIAAAFMVVTGIYLGQQGLILRRANKIMSDLCKILHRIDADHRTAALATFSEYFVKNYPGPNTIISDPNWHAPRIFRAALHAIESESTSDRAGKP